MRKIIGVVNSPTDQRRPLAVWDTINFLMNHPGEHSQQDLIKETQISQSRLVLVLSSLSEAGIINYVSPRQETEGLTGVGWGVYRLVDTQSVAGIDPEQIYSILRARIRSNPTALAKVIEYIKSNPGGEYEYRSLAEKLKIRDAIISMILAGLEHIDLLKRFNISSTGVQGRSSVSVNDLTSLFYDLVCTPAKEVAETLSPLPSQRWDGREVETYLQNYNEGRSYRDSQWIREARNLILNILPPDGKEIKLSYIVDLFKERSERDLKDKAIAYHLMYLIKSDQVEQARAGYYRRVVY